MIIGFTVVDDSLTSCTEDELVHVSFAVTALCALNVDLVVDGLLRF